MGYDDKSISTDVTSIYFALTLNLVEEIAQIRYFYTSIGIEFDSGEKGILH